MTRTVKAVLSTFALVFAREVAWRAAREVFRPRQAPKRRTVKKKRNKVSLG